MIGESPFAAFLAGLLASEHGRKVVLIAAPPSPLRLSHGPALSFAPLVRPTSWQLSRSTAPEAVKLLARIGQRTTARTDLVLAARGPAQSYALEHVRHLAIGYGRAVEPSIPAAAGFETAYRVRDVYRLHEPAFWAAVPAWFARLGVVRVPADTPLAHHRNGSCTVAGHDVDHVVFADEPAALAHCDTSDLDAIARRVPMTAFRTEPVPPRADPVIAAMDGSFVLTQTPENALDIVAAGTAANAAHRAGRHLSDRDSVRLAAQSPFETLRPHDGAPIIGALHHSRATLLLGLGPQAVFLAPAIARFLTGAASRAEQAWCEAHRPGRDFARSSVAEFVPTQPEPTP